MVKTQLWGLIYNQNMIAKSNKIEPYQNENGWDFGHTVENLEQEELFQKELVEHHEKENEFNPLTTICIILCCPVFILIMVTWGPFARHNKNCYGHDYFVNLDET